MQVCGLWHAETTVQDTAACAAVEGVICIRADRWGTDCMVCHSQEGAVIRCNAGHCTSAFHPLCARNNGQYLTARESNTGQAMYRAYCPVHSSAQRAKDLEMNYQPPVSFWVRRHSMSIGSVQLPTQLLLKLGLRIVVLTAVATNILTIPLR